MESLNNQRRDYALTYQIALSGYSCGFGVSNQTSAMHDTLRILGQHNAASALSSATTDILSYDAKQIDHES
jgi:hypothetical protein